MVFIYILEKNNVPFYIGKTVNPFTRENNHVKTFGLDIIFTIIDQCNIDEWRELESWYISLFKSWGFILENKNSGGGGVCSHNEFTKEKIGNANRGKPKPQSFIDSKKGVKRREGWIHWTKNKPLKKEHREKIGKSLKGISKNMKPIIQYSMEGEFIKRWESLTLASKELKISPTNILCNINKHTQQAGGFLWVRENESKPPPYFKKPSHSKGKVIQQDMKGEPIKIWENARIASIELGLNYSAVNAVLNGKGKSSGGFRWEYLK